MPNYNIQLTKTAQKQLNKLSDHIAKPLLEAISQLSYDPRPIGCKKLKGREAYRLRKGKYRIIYDIIDSILTIEIVAIGHRKDIYE